MSEIIVYTNNPLFESGIRELLVNHIPKYIDNDFIIVDSAYGHHIIDFCQQIIPGSFYIIVDIYSSSAFTALYEDMIIGSWDNINSLIIWLENNKELIRMIYSKKMVFEGKSFIPSKISNIELKILCLSLSGRTIDSISDEFRICAKTIYTHRYKAARKIGFRSFNRFCYFAFKSNVMPDVLTPSLLKKLQRIYIN